MIHGESKPSPTEKKQEGQDGENRGGVPSGNQTGFGDQSLSMRDGEKPGAVSGGWSRSPALSRPKITA